MWVALGYGVANGRGRMGDWAHAAKQAIRHARAAGRWSGDDFGLLASLIFGSTPADEALRELDGLLPGSSHPVYMLKRALLVAMLGRFDEARALADAANQRLEEFGVQKGGVWLAEISAVVGDYEAAARYGRRSVDAFREQGHLALQASYGTKLGRWLCLLGRFDEAEPLARLGQSVGFQEEEWDWRQVRARVHAHRGEHAEAERLAREAIAFVDRTDALSFQGDAYRDLAEVLAAAGRGEESAGALGQALERYERKNNLAMVAQLRPKLEQLRRAAPICLAPARRG